MRNLPYFSAVFFDRDGTLIVDKHYLGDPDGVELIAGCKELIARLIEQKRLLFVVSNQSGIGRGLHSKADADACNARMIELLACPSPPFAEIAYCPHAPDAGCRCRKPSPGMWEEIARRHPVVKEHTLMVGDKADDLNFARNAGLGASALVLTGKGEQTARTLGIGLPEQANFLVMAHETRPGFPQIVAKDCNALMEAIDVFEQAISRRVTTNE